MAVATIDPLDHLDASLRDFEPSLGSPAHSGFRSDDAASDMMNDSAMEEEVEEEEDLEDASAGGYSPPAWRRLGNGDRSSGFWRNGSNLNGGGGGAGGMDGYGFGGFDLGGRSRGSSPEYESDGDVDEILEQAIRTRLPTGSLSPEKERSPEPERVGLLGVAAKIKTENGEDDMKATMTGPKEVSENCKLTKPDPGHDYPSFPLPHSGKSMIASRNSS